MNDSVFYNKNGKAIAYISDKDDETIYLFDGTPVAWIYNESIYSFRGKHLGWFLNGWVYDNDGYAVFYTKNAYDGLVKPCCQVTPVKQVAKIKPVKGARSASPVKPVKRLSWRRSDDFFR